MSTQFASLHPSASREEGQATEAELVRRAQSDPDAFGKLYRRHYPLIERYVRRRLGSREVIEDIVSETFLVAFRERQKYEDRGLPFGAWLYSIATSQISRWARRHRRLESLDEGQVVAARDEVSRVCLAQVRAALQSLPWRFQDPLSLHYLEGFNIEEVASILDCPPGTVKSRLARGRDKLKRKLGPAFSDQSLWRSSS